MTEGLPRDRPALGVGAIREALREVAERHAAVRHVHHVEEQPDGGAHGADEAVRQHAARQRDRGDRGVLDGLCQPMVRGPVRRQISAAGESTRGTIVDRTEPLADRTPPSVARHTAGKAVAPRPSNRTASFSVVNTACAPVSATRAAMRASPPARRRDGPGTTVLRPPSTPPHARRRQSVAGWQCPRRARPGSGDSSLPSSRQRERSRRGAARRGHAAPHMPRRCPASTLRPTPRPASRPSRRAHGPGPPRPPGSRKRPRGSTWPLAISPGVVTSTSRSRASRQVLKPVVEHVHGGAELTLRQHAGQMSILRDAHHRARHRARQHQRFVAGVIQGRAHVAPVRDDHHAGQRIVAACSRGSEWTGRSPRSISQRQRQRRSASSRSHRPTGCRC